VECGNTAESYRRTSEKRANSDVNGTHWPAKPGVPERIVVESPQAFDYPGLLRWCAVAVALFGMVHMGAIAWTRGQW
jgi:hypothetical protein